MRQQGKNVKAVTWGVDHVRTKRPGIASATQGPMLFAAVLLALASIAVLGQLSNLLAGMHVEGEASYGIDSLKDPTYSTKVTEAWDLWDCGEVNTSGSSTLTSCKALEEPRRTEDDRLHESPRTIAGLYLLIDGLVFLVAYGFVAWSVIKRADTLDILRRRVARALPIALVVSLVADEIENLAAWLTIDRNGDPAWSRVMAIASSVKWVVAISLALILVFAFWSSSVRGSSTARLLKGVALVRVPLITVGLTALVLAGPPFADQMADAIRRWNMTQFTVTAVFIFGLVSFIWRSARDTVTRVLSKKGRTQGMSNMGIELSPLQLLQIGASVLIFAAVVGLLVWPLLGVAWLRGLAVPAGLVVLLAAIGLLVDPNASDQTPIMPDANPQKRYAASQLLPRLLAVLIPIIVGLVVIRAAIGEFALDDNRSSVLPLLWGLAAFPIAIMTGAALRLKLSHGPDASRAGITTNLLNGAAGVAVIVVSYTIFGVEAPGIRDAIDSGVLVALGSVMVASGLVFYYLLEAVEAEMALLGYSMKGRSGARIPPKVPARLLGIAALLAVFWLYVSPQRAPVVIGGAGVALLFVWVFGVFLRLLTEYAERSEAPLALRRLSVNRVPVFVGLILWLLIMSLVWNESGFHDVQIQGRIEAASAAPSEPSPNGVAVFSGWEVRARELYGERMADRPTVASEIRKPAVPMLFISAWGGGIRAGVWTAYVLDCALESHGPGSEPCHEGTGQSGDETRRLGAVIAASGISGGSLGLANYIAHVVDEPGVDPQGWVETRMSDDYVAPPLARLLFVDLPLSLLGGDAQIPDRADTMQAAWQQSWSGESDAREGLNHGIRELWSDGFSEYPLVVMNSASIKDACGINVSGFALGVAIDGVDECRSLAGFDTARSDVSSADFDDGDLVGTRDALDYLCEGEDISLGAAALMSARFPGMSPSGRLAPGNCNLESPAIYSTDGGQLELSGTLTATQLWEMVDDKVVAHNSNESPYCIAPLLIHMENGFSPDEVGVLTDQPNEWVDPLLFSLTSAKGGLVKNIRQRAALEFSEPLKAGTHSLKLVGSDGTEIPRFAYVRTKANPGPSAPLGWALSEATFDDLREQLDQNESQFSLIEKWLNEPMFCEYSQV